ncbi:putative RNase H-like nuclease (RuvC/YqgF family) [Rhodoblastus acidophilus]|uniref:hypothetical protein n=1 Tax=Rhodoblastus acidophilus TaxID=1074 RepID=UPI00222495D4|nr:hypothetical protein [Rhodoblastus acidophilus]MCW2285688.1 putative RNase H-like nuclease (RuvC/YqgF family) [Rhodoblastus acidophilus]MCW2333060.1 putative RNase H-like nuclease (RuvC/YqgF family) [Rhodoblastus acidophilus]
MLLLAEQHLLGNIRATREVFSQALELPKMSALALVETDPPTPDAIDDSLDAAVAAATTALAATNAEFRRLEAERPRLEKLVADENAVIAEIGEIGAREIEAARQWALNACNGPAPQPEFEARRDAQERLLASQMKAAGAERALSDLEIQHAELHQKGRQLSEKLDLAIFNRLIDDYEVAVDATKKAYDEARLKGADLLGMRRAMYDRCAAMRQEGKSETLDLHLMQRLEKLEVPQIDQIGIPFNGDVEASTAASAARIKEFLEAAR